MGKLLKALAVLVISVVLIFFQALFAFKLYTWFGPETGLELPVLTYYNMVAILFVTSVFRMNLNTTYKLDKIYDSLVEDKQDSLLRAISKIIDYLLGILVSYCYYIAIY